MHPVTRREKIKEIVMNRQIVSVAELASELNVTGETIRRDLAILDENGFLIKMHGGAQWRFNSKYVPSTAERAAAGMREKKIIAQVANSLICEGDSVFLDFSTTCSFIAEAVKNRHLTVLTNSLVVANTLRDSRTINLIVAGGMLDYRSMAFYGEQTDNMLSNYYVDKMFFSCRTLSLEHGVTDFDEVTAKVRKNVLTNARKVYLCLDSTKYSTPSFVRICDFDSLTGGIITDSLPNEKWNRHLQAIGCPVYMEPVTGEEQNNSEQML